MHRDRDRHMTHVSCFGIIKYITENRCNTELCAGLE